MPLRGSAACRVQPPPLLTKAESSKLRRTIASVRLSAESATSYVQASGQLQATTPAFAQASVSMLS